METLKYCDIENESPNRFVYEYRTAYIHFGLASLSSDRLGYVENVFLLYVNNNFTLAHCEWSSFKIINCIQNIFSIICYELILNKFMFNYQTMYY